MYTLRICDYLETTVNYRYTVQNYDENKCFLYMKDDYLCIFPK